MSKKSYEVKEEIILEAYKQARLDLIRKFEKNSWETTGFEPECCRILHIKLNDWKKIRVSEIVKCCIEGVLLDVLSLETFEYGVYCSNCRKRVI